jgi:hypothetical protein
MNYLKMNKYFILAGLFFSVGLSAQNWQIRLRGISVQPNEKSTIDVIGGMQMFPTLIFLKWISPTSSIRILQQN